MVTIAIPAYKARFLSLAIESVLGQTETDFELVILNDGSPEGIADIVSRYRDPRVKYHANNQNVGGAALVRTWNQCLALAQGEYFVLFSDDDVYEPTFIAEMLKLARQYPKTDLFHCRIRQIDENGTALSHSPLAAAWESVYDLMWHRIIQGRYHYVGDFLCRTAALRKAGGFVEFPMAWSTDLATWFRLSENGGVAFCPQPLFNYRYSTQHLSNRGNPGQKIEAMRQFERWMGEFMAGLHPAGRLDEELLGEVRRKLPIFVEKAIANALSAGCRGTVLGYIQVIRNWLQCLPRHDAHVTLLLRALLTLYRQRRTGVLGSTRG